MYNLIEYSDICFKTSGSLWQYYGDKPNLDYNKYIIDFSVDKSNSISFRFKEKITGQTGNNGTKDVEIMFPLKHLSNLWRTLQIPLINCEVSLMLSWSKKCLIIAGIAADQEPTFTITDTKRYVSVVTLQTQDIVKLLKQLESNFESTIAWNKYQSKTTEQTESNI